MTGKNERESHRKSFQLVTEKELTAEEIRRVSRRREGGGCIVRGRGRNSVGGCGLEIYRVTGVERPEPEVELGIRRESTSM